MERKPRKKLIKKFDLMLPIDVTQLGGENDPCFGKHYDGRESECQRCGDSELCILKMGQTNHTERKQIESENKFKDIEPEDYKPDTQLIYKYIQGNLFNDRKVILLSSALKKITKEFRLDKELSKKEITLIVRKIAKQAVDLKIVKKGEKKYLKLVP